MPVVVRLTSSSVSEPVVPVSEIPVVGDEVVVTLSIVPESTVVAVPTSAGPAAEVSEIVPAGVKLTVPALVRLTAVPPVVLTVRSDRSQVPVVALRFRPPAAPDERDVGDRARHVAGRARDRRRSGTRDRDAADRVGVIDVDGAGQRRPVGVGAREQRGAADDEVDGLAEQPLLARAGRRCP